MEFDGLIERCGFGIRDGSRDTVGIALPLSFSFGRHWSRGCGGESDNCCWWELAW